MDTDRLDRFSMSTHRNHQEGRQNIISNLPWEVLQDIFAYLDVKSLLACKSVCTNWREHINHIKKKPTFWYDGCQKEIPSWIQYDILDNIYPSHWKDQSQVNWEEVYKCCYIWDFLYETPVTISKFVHGVDGITAIKVSGECLLLTTAEKRGRLLGHHLAECDNLMEAYVGGGPISNFQLVVSDGCRSLENPFKFLSRNRGKGYTFFLKHNEIWLESKTWYIVVGKHNHQPLDKIEQRVRHSYGYEVRLIKHRSHSSTLIFKKTCSKVQGPELAEFHLSSPYTEILDIWQNKMALDYTSGKVRSVDSVEWSKQEPCSTVSFGFTHQKEDCKTYSWHSSLFVVYSRQHRITICYNGKVEEQVTPFQRACVTSVLFYANHFFVGTASGFLMIYKVKSPEDCMSIKVYVTPCWEVEVCPGEAICNLAVAEPVQCSRKRPVILCATSEDVYKVSM